LRIKTGNREKLFGNRYEWGEYKILGQNAPGFVLYRFARRARQPRRELADVPFEVSLAPHNNRGNPAKNFF